MPQYTVHYDVTCSSTCSVIADTEEDAKKQFEAMNPLALAQLTSRENIRISFLTVELFDPEEDEVIVPICPDCGSHGVLLATSGRCSRYSCSKCATDFSTEL